MDRTVVFVRDGGRVTIPASVRDTYGLEEGTALILAQEKGSLVLQPGRELCVGALLDSVGHAPRERGISLEDLLEDGEAIREEVFRERYPDLAKKHALRGSAFGRNSGKG